MKIVLDIPDPNGWWTLEHAERFAQRVLPHSNVSQITKGVTLDRELTLALNPKETA